MQVVHEARLVDAHDRGEAHGHGRELPEVRHQPGMRVGGQALAFDLAAKVHQLRLAQAPVQEGARVHAGGGVALEVHQVAGKLAVGRAKEVVEADADQGGRRGIGGDVPAELGVFQVRLDHHGERVPALQRTHPVFHARVTRQARLLLDRDGVDVGRGVSKRQVHAADARTVDEPLDQVMGALGPVSLEHRIQCRQPFASLLRVDVLPGALRL